MREYEGGVVGPEAIEFISRVLKEDRGMGFGTNTGPEFVDFSCLAKPEYGRRICDMVEESNLKLRGEPA